MATSDSAPFVALPSGALALARAWRRAFDHYQDLSALPEAVWLSSTGQALLDRWNQREMQICDKFERLYPGIDLYELTNSSILEMVGIHRRDLKLAKDLACVCSDLDALSCYRNRHAIDPGDLDYALEVACECICHAENREDDRDYEPEPPRGQFA